MAKEYCQCQQKFECECLERVKPPATVCDYCLADCDQDT